MLALAHSGHTLSSIVEITGFRKPFCEKVLARAPVKRSLKKTCKLIQEEVFKDKVPALKNIVSDSLFALSEAIAELRDPEIRKKVLSDARSLKALASVVADLNGLLRLELGQSTENVQQVSYSYQQTRVVLQELAKIDPVFEYPQLPEPKNEQ